jgi:hypothetical protein
MMNNETVIIEREIVVTIHSPFHLLEEIFS